MTKTKRKAQREHHYLRVIITFNDGETSGNRVFKDKTKAEEYAARQKKSPTVRARRSNRSCAMLTTRSRYVEARTQGTVSFEPSAEKSPAVCRYEHANLILGLELPHSSLNWEAAQSLLGMS
jgi:hypothetical protein